MPSKPHYDILVPGNYFCDLIFTGLPGFPELGTEIYTKGVSVVPGGGALNTAVALRRLDINVGWMSVLGNDFFSHFIKHFIQDEGLDTSLITHLNEPLRRVTVALSYPTDRAFVTYVDDSPNNVSMALRALDEFEFSHLHFTGLMIDDRVPDLIDACHSRQIRVSMDCQHRDVTVREPLIRAILERVDVFMPNMSEAQRLTETSCPSEAMDALADLASCIVVKSGAEGAHARCGKHNYHSQALESEVIDTTGAGDVFNAGFLAAYIQNKPLEDCLRWGNFCGGMSVRGFGGSGAAPRRLDLEAWLERSL